MQISVVLGSTFSAARTSPWAAGRAGSRTPCGGTPDVHRLRAALRPRVIRDLQRWPRAALTSRGWYDLTVSRRRSPNGALPSTALSTASSVACHFSTDLTPYRQIRAALTRFSPAGLDAGDQAAPGAHTTVALALNRPAPNDDLVHQLSDSVKKVLAWSSTVGGRSRHAVPVRLSGGAWGTSVPDPAAGVVSLRSEVTDSHGDTTTTTVVNAYAVG